MFSLKPELQFTLETQVPIVNNNSIVNCLNQIGFTLDFYYSPIGFKEIKGLFADETVSLFLEIA